MINFRVKSALRVFFQNFFSPKSIQLIFFFMQANHLVIIEINIITTKLPSNSQTVLVQSWLIYEKSTLKVGLPSTTFEGLFLYDFKITFF